MLFKLFKCASKPKKLKNEIKIEIGKLKLENQELKQKVSELTNYIKTLEAAASEITDLKNTNRRKQLDIQKRIEEPSSAAKKDEIPMQISQTEFNSDDSILSTLGSNESPNVPSDPHDSRNAENSIYLVNERQVNEEILRSLPETAALKNSRDLKSTDNISALVNTTPREACQLRRMPTPLKKPPSQLSTQTYENLFDRRTGKPRNDSLTKSQIKKLYQTQS
uniref:Uncharacterized protein n=1 Tax=Acrobeloides nanus TaxID=290746 RepID=A0A914CR82_9BILA